MSSFVLYKKAVRFSCAMKVEVVKLVCICMYIIKAPWGRGGHEVC